MAEICLWASIKILLFAGEANQLISRIITSYPFRGVYDELLFPSSLAYTLNLFCLYSASRKHSVSDRFLMITGTPMFGVRIS
jgi:hypothetical protein